MTYKYKNNLYYIESAGEMKNPETRKWESCIIYISLSDGKRYVREEKEFDKLFEFVEE